MARGMIDAVTAQNDSPIYKIEIGVIIRIYFLIKFLKATIVGELIELS